MHHIKIKPEKILILICRNRIEDRKTSQRKDGCLYPTDEENHERLRRRKPGLFFCINPFPAAALQTYSKL